MAGALTMAGHVAAHVFATAERGRSLLRRSEISVGALGAIGDGHQLRRRGVFRPTIPNLRFPPGVVVRALTPAHEWVGLPHWRTKPMNERRVWGKRNVPTSATDEWEHVAAVVAKEANARHMVKLHSEKVQTAEGEIAELMLQQQEGASLAEWGAIVLGTADPVKKAVLTHHAYRLWCDGALPLGVADAPDWPARPAKPELVILHAANSHLCTLCFLSFQCLCLDPGR